jgi:hypothetical protein
LKTTDRFRPNTGDKAVVGQPRVLVLSKPDKSERRSSIRFPLKLPANVQGLEFGFDGTTLNISSGGLLMSSDHIVHVGTPLTVRVTWPIRRRNKTIALIVRGFVVRSEGGLIAIQKHQYSFDEVSRRPFLLKQTPRPS